METRKGGRSGRDRTDESLATERENADRAVSDRMAASERKADGVLARARQDADEVLDEARARADEVLLRPETSRADAARTLEDERDREDEVVRHERATADEVLRQQRALALTRLFPVERDQTDLFLMTERHRADDAVATRDDFLAMVAHDLRDLLNSIVISAETLRAADDDGVAVAPGIQRIHRAAGRMNRLIGDLVNVASIDAGRLQMTIAPVDAAVILADAIETWAPVAAAKEIRLVTVAADGATVAVLDAHRIAQVLGNLIANAAKFSPRGSRIVCSVEAADGGLRFCVRDGGVGIAADKLGAIFERFWQVGGHDRRGLGLGLYISRCIIAAHGGRIWAESEPGQGSAFFFTVPPPTAAPPPDAAPAPR